MATRALTPDREKMTSLLKEMMRRSPDPHLPEERDRISDELSDRAFPFVVFLKKADEDQAARVTAVFTYWFEDAYDGLLENYPRSASPAEQATKEGEDRDGHDWVATAQPEPTHPEGGGEENDQPLRRPDEEGSDSSRG